MNSPKPYSEDELDLDELDRLIRKALKAMASGQEPPECVWKRIKAELEKGKSPPGRFRLPWLSLAVQPTLTLLLVMLGGIGLQTLIDSDGVRNSSRDPLPPVATVFVEERLSSSNATAISEERDLYLLKTQYRLMARSDAEPEDDPPEMSSLKRRSPKAEPTSSLCPACAGLRPIKEGNILKGGPYEN